jgi:hypothetical protein
VLTASYRHPWWQWLVGAFVAIVSHGNADERAEARRARRARRQEYEAMLRQAQHIHAAKAYSEVIESVLANGVDAASGEQDLGRLAAERAREHLIAALGPHRLRRPHASSVTRHEVA